MISALMVSPSWEYPPPHPEEQGEEHEIQEQVVHARTRTSGI